MECDSRKSTGLYRIRNKTHEFGGTLMHPTPQEPVVPELTSKQIEELTDIVFLPIVAPEPCDAIFIFGGTYPGHWQQAIVAYHKGYGTRVIVTGGVKPNAFRHPTWPDAQMPEADGIRAQLVEGGVKPSAIVFENRSRNTLENVLFAQEVFDFSSVRRVLIVGKSFGMGRGQRTLAQNVPVAIQYIPFGFDTDYHGHFISRDDWMHSTTGRNLVLGEHLKILRYGRMGHVLPLAQEIDGLQGYVETNMEH